MHLNPTLLVRRARRDEAGAVAIVVALMSVLLFSIGALAIDLGNAYARKRVSQTTADLAALAGAAQLGVTGGVAEARKAAIDYVRSKNPTQSDDGLAVPDCAVTSATAPVCWDNDGNVDNGEISFTDNLGLETRGIGATRIRVITPRREVTFGLAAIMGFSKVSVTKAATAGVFSPGGASAPPFYLTNTDKGLTCIKDDSNGPSKSPLRAALLAAPPITAAPTFGTVTPATSPELTAFTITITGNNLKNTTSVRFIGLSGTFPASNITANNNDKEVTANVPNTIPAGTYQLTVSGSDGMASQAYVFSPKAPAPAAPTATVFATPPGASGPELTASSFTLNGTGLIAGTVVTFGGGGNATNVVVAANGLSLTGTTPAAAAGTYLVQVSNANGTSATGPAYTFAASPAPVIALAPVAGPETATNTVLITGTNLPTTVTTASVTFGGKPVQTITRDSTTGSLTVKPPVGVANTTVQVVVYNGSTPSNSVPYLYFPDPTACPGTSSNRGYLDEPRVTSNAQSLVLNIQQGIDHNIHAYQTYRLASNAPERPIPATGVECGSLDAGTVLQSGSSSPIPDINCVRLRTGSISGSLESGYFDNAVGRMYQLEPGASTGTIGGHSGVDEDSLFDPRFVDPVNLTAFTTAVLSGATPTVAQQGWLKEAVLRCPRFALLPVTNAPDNPPNGTTYYPVIGFKGMFITSSAADTSADHGFTFGGGSLKVVKGIVFDLKWISPNISSSAVIATQDYVGVGPRIAKLVRDADDGNY